MAHATAERLGHERVGIVDFLGLVRWIDGTPMLDHVEPYRRPIFEAFDAVEPDGRARYNLGLVGRAKKNWKSADLVLMGLTALLANDAPHGNVVYLLANDEGQADGDLALAKNIVAASPLLRERLLVKKKVIERRDRRGFCEILPAQDEVGQHGKSYRAALFDELHGYKTWDLLEAMQLDPTRPSCLRPNHMANGAPLGLFFPFRSPSLTMLYSPSAPRHAHYTELDTSSWTVSE